MGLYSAAVPKLIKHNFSKSGMSKTPMGLVVHIADSSTLQGIHAWFDNPDQTSTSKGVVTHIKASAHFAVGMDGAVWQFVDTDHQAFGMGGKNSNQNWISVENVGYGGNQLTGAQITSLGALLGWLHETKHVPLRLAANSSEQGLAYHSIDKNWGRPGCPGQPIIDQLPQVVLSAQVGF
jgi:N-acetyl-anhydromuramyl-L-alanine amidase AmpD